MPSALIITTAGINCDRELGESFEAAGARAEYHHLNELMADPSIIDGFDLIGMPGGFSYGDAVAAGRIAANLMRRTLYQALVRAIERGVPIFCPCNGFQMAAQIGILPGPRNGEAWQDEPPTPTIALAANASGRFVDCWSRVTIPDNTRCIWTNGLDAHHDTMMLPSAHGEGRFVAADKSVIADLESRGQVAVRYVSDENPNGSVGDIAGICDATGLVFGLMPHPERYTRWTQHPFWTRLDASLTEGDPPGLAMFRNAVAHAMHVQTV